MAVNFEGTFKYGGKGDQSDKDEILRVLADIAEKHGFDRFKASEELYYFGLCEGAYLEARFPGVGEAAFYFQGTPIGAGAHAAAVDFVDDFVKTSSIKVSMRDETGYYEHRDFERMRAEHYHVWLRDLVDFAARTLGEDPQADIAVGWSPDNYRPEHHPGFILTHMGRFAVSELRKRIEKEGVAPFAADFFIWNNRGRDALLFRNTALSYLWKDCFFKPSTRSEQDREVNGAIISLLEEAARMQPDLPFPKREYLELCALDGREFMDIGGLSDYAPFPAIGYRRELVRYHYGNQSLGIPGHFLPGMGKDGKSAQFFDAIRENWHGLTVWPTPVDGPVNGTAQKFDDEFFSQCRGKAEEFELGHGGRCRAAYLGSQKDDGEVYHTVLAEVISPLQVTFLSISFSRESEKDWAFKLLRGIEVRETPAAPAAGAARRQ